MVRTKVRVWVGMWMGAGESGNGQTAEDSETRCDAPYLDPAYAALGL
jgi:hypothetical protein